MGNFNSANNVAALAKLSGLGTGVGTFLATPSSANLLAALTTKTGTGNNVFADNPTLTTPILGVASATSLATSGLITSSSATAGIGYTTGAGGTVTQATSKSTGVTLDKVSGKITMSNAALEAASTVTFILTNSTIVVGDTMSFAIVGGEATDATYQIYPAKITSNGSAKITILNGEKNTLSEAVQIQFNVHKGASS